MRKSWDSHFLNIAVECSTMSTCIRRSVGCVLINDRRKILSTGFNGTPPGWPHCNEGTPCPGANLPSGQGLDLCYSNHSEINALTQCTECWSIDTAYITSSPCISCVKALMCTSTKRIVFIQEYPHPEAQALWSKHGGVWVRHKAA